MLRTRRTRCAVGALLTALVIPAVVATGAAHAATAAADMPQTVGATAGTKPATTSANPSYTPAGCDLPPKNAKPEMTYARCFALVRTVSPGGRVIASAASPDTGALGPADIQAAYKLPATGQGQTVAVVDANGDSSAESDLAKFRSRYGLPVCTTANGCFRKVDQAGGSNFPEDDPGWGLETSLDLDAVSAACPACHILLVEANSASIDDLGTAAGTAVALGAKFVSNSYGVPGEFNGENAFNHYYDHPGVAVTASTGDIGDVTNWPATDPNVVSVGGTTLTRDSSTPRGWTETAWARGGSGCSPYEPKPGYQASLSTNCSMRAIADVSADADPATGLAVYDTLGQGGWLQVGGTSLSSPLVASMYALAGTPTPNTYPVTYPYQKPGALFDITQGSNGGCGNVLCTAGPGWDGPTGLGTPDGVAALSNGPHGDLAGQVTDTATGKPVSGAAVTLTPGGYAASTGANGNYDLTVPPGSYTATAAKFGYKSASQQNLQVNQDQTTTGSFTLTPVPTHTVSGTVTDARHGWPVYAAITIDGYPGGTIDTDPYTGAYSVALPEGATYTLHVSPVALPGYQTAVLPVSVATSDVTQNVTLTADPAACAAPGYGWTYNGTGEDFTGWTGNTPKDGWTVTDNNGSGQTWRFDDPRNDAPPPGGDAHFAVVSYDYVVTQPGQDTSLISPAVTLASQPTPMLKFDTGFVNSDGAPGHANAYVDLSLDGGQTWANVWDSSADVSEHVAVPIAQAAGKSGVKVRFHYVGHSDGLWAVDNVVIGSRTCGLVPGGIVSGVITDANTHTAVDGATVTSTDKPADQGVSASLPAVPGAPDGYYWLFSSLTGSHPFAVTDGHYTPADASVDVAPNVITRRDWTLAAGHLTVKPGAVTVTQRLGGSNTVKLTVTNDGTAAVHATVGAQDGGFTPMAAVPNGAGAGAPLLRVKVPAQKYPLGLSALPVRGRQPRVIAAHAAPAATGGTAWASIANYPMPIMDNAMALYGGKLYSVGGISTGAVQSFTAAGYVYDPSTQRWSPIAPLPVPLIGANAAFLDGKMYVVGGITLSGPSTAVYVYDPHGNSWARAASVPAGTGLAGVAVLDGDLYVVGGYGVRLKQSSAVYRYDPTADTWTRLAPYPLLIAAEGCAGIAGQVVCADGQAAALPTASTYRYQPAANTWVQGADAPYAAETVGYAGSGGKLQIAGGLMIPGPGPAWYVTNQAAQYDPVRNAWTGLPRPAYATEWGGSACGFYRVGGSDDAHTAGGEAQVLPGYDQCGGSPSWLSVPASPLTLNPGQSATLTVKLSSASLSQPGDYTSGVWFDTDTPYVMTPLALTDHVTPPASWGKLAGTVTDTNSKAPIGGATVQVCTHYRTSSGSCGPTTFTLTTDQSGHFQLWLGHTFSPLLVSAAKNGYQPRTRVVTITAGATSTADFTLTRS